MRTQKSRILQSLFLLVFLAVLAAKSGSITSKLRITFVDAASPALSALDGLSSSLKKLVPFASFREENRNLRERINFLSRKLEELKMVEAENVRLKNLLDFQKNSAYTIIPAQVIGRDPTNWSNSIIIDKGLTKGIREGKAVLYTKGLIGRVLEVGRYSSKILLITDPNSKVGVVIQRNRQGGILTGRPDGTCKVIYLSVDSDVSVRDKVITAGFGGAFPKDILVGEVVKVGKEPGRLYKYAIVKPAEDLSKLEEVLCIR